MKRSKAKSDLVKCSVCGKNFKSQGLGGHMRSHKGMDTSLNVDPRRVFKNTPAMVDAVRRAGKQQRAVVLVNDDGTPHRVLLLDDNGARELLFSVVPTV